jgi:hypothetical protein
VAIKRALVPVLYRLCVHAALHDGGEPATDARVVGVVGDIIGLVVQSRANVCISRSSLMEAFLTEVFRRRQQGFVPRFPGGGD